MKKDVRKKKLFHIANNIRLKKSKSNRLFPIWHHLTCGWTLTSNGVKKTFNLACNAEGPSFSIVEYNMGWWSDWSHSRHSFPPLTIPYPDSFTAVTCKIRKMTSNQTVSVVTFFFEIYRLLHVSLPSLRASQSRTCIVHNACYVGYCKYWISV